MATLTPLSTLLNRMNRWQTISTVEEQFKVYDLDEAIRTIRRDYQFPWCLQHGSLRVFSDVLEYPVPDDFDEIAYVDNVQTTNLGSIDYGNRARFKYTSLQQFYENPDDRNDLAEIWDGNSKFIGVRYQTQGNIGASQLVNNAETVSNWTASGDASNPTLDNVNYKDGNGSIRFSVVSSSGTAGMAASITPITDANYKRKYFFIWVYLDAVPTSIVLRLGNDSTNHYYQTVTTQFSGQPLKADQWNLLAMDLNTALESGTPTSTAMDYQAITLLGADTGTYYVDSSYLREWELMDLWYYSKYNVALTGSNYANQEYFMDTTAAYSLDSNLIGDSEWSDCVMYDAMLTSITDKENSNIYSQVKEKRDNAWKALIKKYPSMMPVIITDKYRFISEFNNSFNDYQNY